MKKAVFLFILFFLPLIAWAELNTFAIISDTHVGAPDSIYKDFIDTI